MCSQVCTKDVSQGVITRVCVKRAFKEGYEEHPMDAFTRSLLSGIKGPDYPFESVCDIARRVRTRVVRTLRISPNRSSPVSPSFSHISSRLA